LGDALGDATGDAPRLNVTMQAINQRWSCVTNDRTPLLGKWLPVTYLILLIGVEHGLVYHG
jgi:hypothetical protein